MPRSLPPLDCHVWVTCHPRALVGLAPKRGACQACLPSRPPDEPAAPTAAPARVCATQVYQASLVPKGTGDAFCKYDDPTLSLFVSVLFLAGIPGAFLGSLTNNWWGRRPTMMIGGANFLVGAALMSGAVHIAMLVVGRIFLGIGIGISVMCGPLYLSELAPAHLRGLFNTQFQVRAWPCPRRGAARRGAPPFMTAGRDGKSVP